MDDDPLDLLRGDDPEGSNTINDFSKNVSGISEAGRFEIILWGDRDSRKDFFLVYCNGKCHFYLSEFIIFLEKRLSDWLPGKRRASSFL